MATRLPDRLCERLSVLKRRKRSATTADAAAGHKARCQRWPALALLLLLLLLLLVLCWWLVVHLRFPYVWH
jgi:hypothetical protein